MSAKKAGTGIDQILEATEITPVALVGRPGIGKTQRVLAFGEKLGIPTFIWTTPGHDVVDFQGIPIIGPDGVVWSPPEVAKTLAAGPALFLADEVDKAVPPVQASLMKLLSERRFGETLVHPEVRLALAWNPTNQGGLYEVLDTLIQRVVRFHVTADADEWVKYMAPRTNAFDVLGYISKNQDALSADPTAPGQPAPSPRQWEKVCKAVDKGYTGEFLDTFAEGAVGGDQAAMWKHFRDNQDLPSLEEVLSGLDLSSFRPDQLYVIGAMLNGEAGKKGTRKMPQVWSAVERIMQVPGAADIGGMLTRRLARDNGKAVPPELISQVGDLLAY